MHKCLFDSLYDLQIIKDVPEAIFVRMMHVKKLFFFFQNYIFGHLYDYNYA